MYGVSKEKPMLLLTSKEIKNKEEVHNVVRSYMSRWKIESYFRFKKQEYGLEGVRLRTLKGQRVMNMFLTSVIGKIATLIEQVNEKLLSIKIIERSKSLRKKVSLWYYQFSRGIKEILKNANVGIKVYQEIEQRKQYKQLRLNI